MYTGGPSSQLDLTIWPHLSASHETVNRVTHVVDWLALGSPPFERRFCHQLRREKGGPLGWGVRGAVDPVLVHPPTGPHHPYTLLWARVHAPGLRPSSSSHLTSPSKKGKQRKRARGEEEEKGKSLQEKASASASAAVAIASRRRWGAETGEHGDGGGEAGGGGAGATRRGGAPGEDRGEGEGEPRHAHRGGHRMR